MRKWVDCDRCGLHKTRRRVVFGKGDLPCDVMFIIEAPSKAEELMNVPIAGKGDKILQEAIDLACDFIEMTERPRIYITLTVACRPCNGKGRDTRPPEGEEAWACFQRLEDEVLEADPSEVVLLGKIAHTYLSKRFPGALKLVHPSFIASLGGRSDPLFIRFARELSEVFGRIQNGQEEKGSKEKEKGTVKRRLLRVKRKTIHD